MKRTARKSDDRMEVFARQYIKLQFNGKHAAIAAGYSKKTAEATASRMLRNSKVKGLLAKFSAPANKKMNISVERTLTELARCAYLDPRMLFRNDGSIKHISELDDDTAACIAGVEMGGRGGKRVERVKMTDKLRALDMLGRYLKLFSEEHAATDLGVRVIVMDMPRPMRQVGSGAAALPPSNGHKPHDE